MVIDSYKMALRDLLVLAILLSCLLAFHDVMEAIIADYTRLHNQRRRLLIELMDATQINAPKGRDILDDFGSGQDEHLYGGTIS